MMSWKKKKSGARNKVELLEALWLGVRRHINEPTAPKEILDHGHWHAHDQIRWNLLVEEFHGPSVP
jgi:hypothetical protein